MLPKRRTFAHPTILCKEKKKCSFEKIQLMKETNNEN